MNRNFENFVETIPDLGKMLGISSLKYLHVAVRQAEYYGYEESAQWLAYWENRLNRCVEEEWRVDNNETEDDFQRA